MIVSYSATTANRYIYTAIAWLCMRLRLIAYLYLLLVNCNDCAADNVNAYEFRAFADFLVQKHLKHAIVAYNGETLKSTQQQQMQKDNALRALANITSLRFYDVHNMKKCKKFTNFKNLILYDISRVGIYLTQLEDVLLQKYVIGTNGHINATSLTQPNGLGVGVDIRSRFNNSQAWFIMSKQHNVEEALTTVRQVITPLPLNISADITLGVRVDNNNTIKLFDIYKIQTDLLEIEEKGYWNPNEGLQYKKRFFQSFVSRRRDFKGLQLRAGIVIREKPDNIGEFEYLNSMDFKKLDPMQRKTYQMLRMLEPMFNVSFHANLTKTWGNHWPNGSWDGVMAMILSGEAEFSMCPMRFVSNRISLIHYTTAVHKEYVLFLFRHPQRNDIRNIFFEPFLEEVWYAVVAVIVLTIMLLQLHLRHEYRFLLNKYPHFQYRLDYAIFSILEAFFMQGPDHNAFAATSTRTLIFFVCLFSLLLQQFYGAFIVGSLLAVTPRTITNLEALYNSSLEIGMEDVPYNLEVFVNSTSPLVHAVYTRRICQNREKHVLSIEEGAKRIGDGGFAFHVSSNRMYILLKNMLTEKEFCELQEVSFIPPFDIGLGIGKSSPFREYLTTSILKLHTTGLTQHCDNQWRPPQMDCSLSQNREVEVDLQHFLPAILLLCSAMVFSVAVLFLEIVYYNLARFCPNLLSHQKFNKKLNLLCEY